MGTVSSRVKGPNGSSTFSEKNEIANFRRTGGDDAGAVAVVCPLTFIQPARCLIGRAAYQEVDGASHNFIVAVHVDNLEPQIVIIGHGGWARHEAGALSTVL